MYHQLDLLLEITKIMLICHTSITRPVSTDSLVVGVPSFVTVYICLSIFNIKMIYRYWAMPGFYLKRMVMENFSNKKVDPDIADSIDFMVENVCTIP